MRAISILNDVLGPVMRGPSSSHTAGPYHIGRLARSLLGDDPVTAAFTFDPGGSFAQVYRQQGSDLGFAAGVLGWEITDERFSRALELAALAGVQIAFSIQPIPGSAHPNDVSIEMSGRNGRRLAAEAKSIGGGAVVFTDLSGWEVQLTGDVHEVLVEMDHAAELAVRELLGSDAEALTELVRQEDGSRRLLHLRRRSPLRVAVRARIEGTPGVTALWAAAPLFHVRAGPPLFDSAAGMVALAQKGRCSLGRAALDHEASLLGVPAQVVLEEVQRRFQVMRAAVARGLDQDRLSLQLLAPSARQIYRSEAAGKLAAGGMHTRAAARALAVMHVNNSQGVVCAAPTAGAAGVLPAVVVTLADELGFDQEAVALALLAAGAVGVAVAVRTTFAAEVAGCQVEIGAAGAMAAAAVVEAAGGDPVQATHAAAISFQNTMGSVCDLVQGRVEIPCHTRNAVAASAAFVCADLVLGGYENPIPLDETLDAVYEVGRAMPRELRVTSLGGLAVTPSALALALASGGGL